MGLVSRLYQLQETDSQLREKHRLLKDTLKRLEHNDELSLAEAELAIQRDGLEKARKHQRQLDWEVDDLTARILAVNDRLYGGSVKNPKELVSLEQDMQGLKRHLKSREEVLLDAMGVVESLEAGVGSLQKQVEELAAEWEREREGLRVLKDSTELEIERLTQSRNAARNEVGPDAVRLYDQLSQAKGTAVVKVELGRCAGCNLTLPTGQWQKARAGEVVKCGSCGRIFYVE
jgi:predicted  nucleic acid-binding Zn-ribbon protein